MPKGGTYANCTVTIDDQGRILSIASNPPPPAPSGAQVTTALAQAAGPVALNSQRLVLLADPVGAQDAATKHYVDVTATPAPSSPLILASHQTPSGTSHIGAPGTTGSSTEWAGLPVGPARTVSSISLNLDAGETGVTFTVTALYSGDYGQAWGAIPGAHVTVDAGAALGGKAAFTPFVLPADSLVMAQLTFTGSPSAHDFVVGLN